MKPTVTAADMEAILGEATRPGVGHVVLDVRGLRDETTVGTARALGVLAELRRREIRVEVLVDLGGHREVAGTRYEKLFVSTSFGFTLSRFAAEIVNKRGGDSVRDEVLALQRAALDASAGIIGKGDHIAMPILDSFPWPRRARLIEAHTATEFTGELGVLLRRLGLPPLPAAGNIADFAWETYENSTEHGTADLAGKKIQALRLIVVRRIALNAIKPQALRDLGPPGPRFVSDLYDREPAEFLAKQVLVEVTVADSGIGIPAQLSGDSTIYDGPVDCETQYVNDAVQVRGTSKAVTDPDVGVGLWKAMHACYELGGVAIVRTGRTTFGRDYTGAERRWPDPTLHPVNDEQHRIGGTAWTLVVPWWERGLF